MKTARMGITACTRWRQNSNLWGGLTCAMQIAKLCQKSWCYKIPINIILLCQNAPYDIYGLVVCGWIRVVILILRPGGVKAIAAENMVLRQQLISLSRVLCEIESKLQLAGQINRARVFPIDNYSERLFPMLFLRLFWWGLIQLMNYGHVYYYNNFDSRLTFLLNP